MSPDSRGKEETTSPPRKHNANRHHGRHRLRRGDPARGLRSRVRRDQAQAQRGRRRDVSVRVHVLESDALVPGLLAAGYSKKQFKFQDEYRVEDFLQQLSCWMGRLRTRRKESARARPSGIGGSGFHTGNCPGVSATRSRIPSSAASHSSPSPIWRSSYQLAASVASSFRSHSGAVALMDDLAARRCAAALGIPYRGCVGLALLAKSRGHVPRARPVIEELRHAGLYSSDEVIVRALSLVGE